MKHVLSLNAVRNEAEDPCEITSPPVKIRVDGLTRRYDGMTVLDDVSFDIADGKFCCVVGPSGCGKTTLLRILAGLDTATAGSLSVRNPMPGVPGNSVVFQGDSIFPWMTVWDNAAYGLKMRRVHKTQIRNTVGHFLEQTGLTRFSHMYPHQLSGGMRQRVSIARAFANDAEILLMDEPFSALDEQNKTILQEELLRIWEVHRKTVVFITHSVDEAVTLGDQIIVMTAQPGRIKKIIEVPLQRPRNVVELRHDRRYGEIVYEIWGHLREEVEKARQR
ncbi:ABC transporter-like protein [Caballeronia udeis]|uniref:ABC transporter-like protein n=1 Tax=Caballeronia udeis TaxID=1232866 RepID=A0A158J3A1_9BURK|nr:ABC transporter ATP-binding protein [Caballeronia udeis]SAL63422.1 ABC transporter-like protein [Caballeronia udeis]